MSKILNIESMIQNSTPNMISKGGNVYIALINSSKFEYDRHQCLSFVL